MRVGHRSRRVAWCRHIAASSVRTASPASRPTSSNSVSAAHHPPRPRPALVLSARRRRRVHRQRPAAASHAADTGRASWRRPPRWASAACSRPPTTTPSTMRGRPRWPPSRARRAPGCSWRCARGCSTRRSSPRWRPPRPPSFRAACSSTWSRAPTRPRTRCTATSTRTTRGTRARTSGCRWCGASGRNRWWITRARTYTCRGAVLAPKPDPSIPIYVGGHSEAAQQLAAELADVYLVWADTLDGIAERLSTMREAEARAGRRVKYGMRCHVIVRETEAEAWAAAERLISRIDPAVRAAFVEAAARTDSVGQQRQNALSAGASLMVEENLWAGVGLARTGVGLAIVGDPAAGGRQAARLPGARHLHVHPVGISAPRGVPSLRRAGDAAAAHRQCGAVGAGSRHRSRTGHVIGPEPAAALGAPGPRGTTADECPDAMRHPSGSWCSTRLSAPP